IPVVTIEDLGILRDVTVDDHGKVIVTITPTYSGCPAMDAIRADVGARLADAGYADAEVVTSLSPRGRRDWGTERGRRWLEASGIAPPTGRASAGPVTVPLSVRCPQCGSADTRELSRFSSTSCKSLWQCGVCAEPFDHFKTL